MADILIRGVPDDVLAAIDANARRSGLSRTEYLRRTLTRERSEMPAVTPESLKRLGELVADLQDPAETPGQPESAGDWSGSHRSPARKSATPPDRWRAGDNAESSTPLTVEHRRSGK